MPTFIEQIASELSFIRAGSLACDWNKGLKYCRYEFVNSGSRYTPSSEDDLLHDVLLKGLLRGERPFPSYYAESWIVESYGQPFGLHENSGTGKGSISYSFNDTLPNAYQEYSDLVDPWLGDPERVAFDPEHPGNERQLFVRLLERFGPRIGHCVATQVELDTILDHKTASDYAGQRADLLLHFPNGECLLLEPGDHEDSAQVALDRRRDHGFARVGIKTLRPRNSAIRTQSLYSEIHAAIVKMGADRFLAEVTSRDDANLVANYLFLLPTLIARIERLLLHFLFRNGMIHRDSLRIGIIERDLECSEIAIASLLDKIERLSRLYGCAVRLPHIELIVQRNPAYRYGDIHSPDIPIQLRERVDPGDVDLLLDVAVKCNPLTPAALDGATPGAAVRTVYPHNRSVNFGYRAGVRPISVGDETEQILSTFVRDYFRKEAMRPGQGPVLINVLSQKSTIGLLPTSAGKSLCYQLAALLTPGTTLVVAPLVALMEDQKQSLVEQYGIDRVLAWHAGSGIHDQNIGSLLCQNLIIFISPERLQRPRFRSAMKSINAADIFINYAVIDEAHCVSMWGHDFRPSYLTLERNFREYCAFQGRTPVLVALTGTASQLVLIDLKRELNITDLEAIVRPETFDRPELNFNLASCTSTEKRQMLGQVFAAIARRLNVQSLDTDAHGIIFAYTPKEVWELFGSQVGDAKGHVRSILSGNVQHLRYGAYTGSPPKEKDKAIFGTKEWGIYKSQTLSAFKRGQIKMLFGNTAVSVGIDNEQLNYVVNFRMPQSMEAYYQQCGRAGRSGQHSECYLIFSDDSPKDTIRWLNREVDQMRNRWDDLGTVAYFHQNSFPGQKQDIAGALVVFKAIFAHADGAGYVDIGQNLGQYGSNSSQERTERYISYWMILGILTDYEVTGMGQNTVYRVSRHPVVEAFLNDKNETNLKHHIIDSLHSYLSRYRPIAMADVGRQLDERQEKALSARSISLLVQFIYSQVEYQRRESIRTMVGFCNEKDQSPDRLRTRIKAYFDSSEKFSKDLLAMADARPSVSAVKAVIDNIDGFDDVEHLYWESRRLLDERFRADWAAINMYSIAYRERTASEVFVRPLDDMIAELREDSQIDESEASAFLCGFLGMFGKLDTVFGEEISPILLAGCFDHLKTKYGVEYLRFIDEIDTTPEIRDYLHTHAALNQLKEMTNAKYSRVVG